MRLFQSEPACYEEVVALVGGDNTHFITRRESATDPPNYILREIGALAQSHAGPENTNQAGFANGAGHYQVH